MDIPRCQIKSGGRGRIRTDERAKRADLQSASFSHLDTLPAKEKDPPPASKAHEKLVTDEGLGREIGGGREHGCPPALTIRLDYVTRRGRSSISTTLTNLRRTIYIVRVIHRYIRHSPQVCLKAPQRHLR